MELLSPIGPDRMPKAMRQRVETIVSKVVRGAAALYFGRSLLEVVYCAGFYHGVETIERLNSNPPQTDGSAGA